MAITRSDFPLPDVDASLTSGFFAAASRDELAIPRCDACDRWVWYPEPACPMCGDALAWTPVSGRGTLFTWAVVERAFLPAFADMVPFVTALVALAEDPNVRVCTYVVGSEPGDLVAEMALTVEFRDLAFSTVADRHVRVPVFRAVTA